MVQVTFDTNQDTLEELEHARSLLEQAIARRGKPAGHKLDMPLVGAPKEAQRAEEADDDAAIDTGFLKIKVVEAHEEVAEQSAQEPAKPAVPTLNQLLNESLSDEELGKLFKEQQKFEDEHPKPKKEKKSEDAYIEIIEYDEK